MHYRVLLVLAVALVITACRAESPTGPTTSAPPPKSLLTSPPPDTPCAYDFSCPLPDDAPPPSETFTFEQWTADSTAHAAELEDARVAYDAYYSNGVTGAPMTDGIMGGPRPDPCEPEFREYVGAQISAWSAAVMVSYYALQRNTLMTARYYAAFNVAIYLTEGARKALVRCRATGGLAPMA